jgi:hypothetical protein
VAVDVLPPPPEPVLSVAGVVLVLPVASSEFASVVLVGAVGCVPVCVASPVTSGMPVPPSVGGVPDSLMVATAPSGPVASVSTEVPSASGTLTIVVPVGF